MTIETKPKRRRRTRKKKGGHYHRGTYVSTRSGEEYHYRSGWENKYMVFLDESPDVVSWSYEKLVIEYVSNKKTGKIRKYYPDFQVTHTDGTSFVIEIKPLKRVLNANVQKKLVAAQAWCTVHGVSLKILTEIELKGLGLL